MKGSNEVRLNPITDNFKPTDYEKQKLKKLLWNGSSGNILKISVFFCKSRKAYEEMV